ncbi:hypothetical protein [Ruania alba]|uniref:ABC-2 type transport system permease protein n=1 Tax=Ruania alba TaxID=648782 RepID=A0A1H5H7Z2_9MICO|nr:hypothetical protein [Ruania alba]SEE24116.1 ABC-2 type transport system permease protein [Ruania alba]
MAGALTEVRHLIGLRRTIESHNESWKRPTGVTLGLLAVAATWAGTLAADPGARGDVIAVIFGLWALGWVIGPILASGASVLRPEYFTLLPLDRRRLGMGLLASVYVGPGAILTFTAMLVLVAHGALLDLWLALLGLLVAVLFTVGLVALSRAVYAIFGAAMRTQVGVEIAAMQYGLLISSAMAGWLVVFPAGIAIPALLADGIGDGPPATVLHALPFGWPGGALAAAAAGDAMGALWRLGALMAAAVLTVAAAVALLIPHVGNRTARRRGLPWGSRQVARGKAVRDPLLALAPTPLGAVVGKELRSWMRDPWRSLEIRTAVWLGVFFALFLYIGSLGQIPDLFRFAPAAALAAAMMVGLSGANLYGQDGTALWMLAVTDSRSAVRADVRGRQIAIVLSLGLPAAILAVALAWLSDGWSVLVPVGAAMAALVGGGAGISALFSVVGVSAGVDPAKRRNATDAGENPLLLQIGFWASALISAPTVAVAVLTITGAGFTGAWWWPYALLAIGVLNGALAAWGLGRAAIVFLGVRMPETFARLRYPGLKLAPGGTGTSGNTVPWWAGTLSDAAQKSYLEARQAKEKAVVKSRPRSEKSTTRSER